MQSEWTRERRKCEGRKKNTSFITLHSPTLSSVGCDGNTNPTRRGKEQETDPKEKKDGVNYSGEKRMLYSC